MEKRGLSKGTGVGREVAIMQEHPLDMLIFFVTGQCNSKCRHCFYWQNLGPDHQGLNLDQVEQLTRSMPRFRTLLLSGGEPSLRADLPELVGKFLDHNQIEHVGVPTNGLLPDRIVGLARRIASLDKKLLVTFSVSIDGFAETHDTVRGVPGSYVAAMETLAGLREVGAAHANFRTHVNTVISAANYTELGAFARHVQAEGLVDGHFFELVRGDPPDKMMKVLPPDDLGSLYMQLLAVQDSYLKREGQRRRGRFGGWLRHIMDMGNLVNRYRHQLTVYSRQRKWDFPCVAGRSIGVVDYDGELRVCELRERSVSLPELAYDFSAAWNSDALREEARIASSHSCDCTHTCFIGISMRQSFVSRLLAAPWWFLRYRLGKLW